MTKPNTVPIKKATTAWRPLNWMQGSIPPGRIVIIKPGFSEKKKWAFRVLKHLKSPIHYDNQNKDTTFLYLFKNYDLSVTT